MESILCGACGKSQKSQVCYSCRNKITKLLGTELTPLEIINQVVTITTIQLKLVE